MRSSEGRDAEQRAGIVDIVLVSALLAVNLAIVGPRTLFTANSSEYGATYWSVLWLLAAAAIALTAALVLLQLALPRRVRGRALVFVFSLAVLAWLQGNWFVGNFGLLDGDALDFEAEASARVRDSLLWIAGIAAAQLLQRALRARVAAIAGIFLALQLVTLPLDWNATDRESAADPPALVAADEIFEFSTGRNLVLLILDTVTSDTFEQFADRDPERFDAAFSGFTFFSDTTGSFPSTQYSVPVMLGAKPYENREPISDYMHASLQRDTITGPLLDADFAVDWVSAWPLFCAEGRHSTCFAIPRPYESPDAYRLQMAAQLVDLSLFRHAPYPLKRAVYRDGDWLLQAALWGEGEAPVFVSSAAAFFDEFTRRIHVGRDEPTFKILHTGGGHGPFVLDAECRPVPSRPYTQANYEAQLRCSIRQTQALLDRLRELGIYDRSLIVVSGDHGASFGARATGSHGLTPARLSRARPLLAVKWPGRGGGLHRSKAPTSLEDIAPTIAAVAGIDAELPGRDLARIEPGEKRRRRYGIYMLRKGKPGGFLERVERYSVAPESRRPGSWSFDGAVFSPDVALDAREIVAGTPTASGHLAYLGWGDPVRSADGETFVPSTGPFATVFAALPPGVPSVLTTRLRVRPWALPQQLEVTIDGVAVGSLRVDHADFAEYVTLVPGRFVRERVTAIGFHAVNSQRAEARGRVSAFDFARLHWQPAEP
jgi:hypothetical protein